MPQNFLITGMPKSGKTVLMREIIEELKERGFKVGGFVSPEETHHGTRTAFNVIDVDTGETAVLASVDGDGPKVSKYHVDIKSFEGVAVPCMQQCSKYDVFVIDEIGRMEMKSRKFSSLLDMLLESKTPFIATVGKDYIDRYGIHGEVFTLNARNREEIFTRVLRRIEAGVLAKKKVPKKPVRKKKKPLREKPRKKKPEKKKKKARPKKKRLPKKKPKEEAKPKKKKPKKKKGLLGRVKNLLGV